MLGMGLEGTQPLSHYHSGVFGKDIPGQWSCCKEMEKNAMGCCETSSQTAVGSFERTQSVATSDQKAKCRDSLRYDEVTASLPALGTEESGYVICESVPVQRPPAYHYVKVERVQEAALQDSVSLHSQGMKCNIIICINYLSVYRNVIYLSGMYSK